MMRATPVLATALAFALGSCGTADEPAVEASEAPLADPAVPAGEEDAAQAAPTLDEAALTDRENPQRLLAYIAAAAAQGQWGQGARAWHEGQMDAAGLKAELGGQEAPRVTFGTGMAEGAAGSLYYETTIEVAPAGASPGRKGTITLRRVNDVPGAEEWQLNWHVDRIAWKD